MPPTSPTDRPAGRIAYRVTAAACFLVPVALLLFVTRCVQSDDDLRNPPRYPYSRGDDGKPYYHLGELVYDENDLAAYCLRGLNAHLGRDAGYRAAVLQVYNDSVYSHLLRAKSLDELLDAETEDEDIHFYHPMLVGKWVAQDETATRFDLLTRYPGYPGRYREWLVEHWPTDTPGRRAHLAEMLRTMPPLEVPGPLPAERLPPRLRHLPPDGWQLRDRYYLEYPHAALWLFQAGWAVQPGTGDLNPPPYLLDGSYLDAGWHEPAGEDEARLWRHFVAASRFYMSASTACLLALMAVILVGYEPRRGLSAHPAWLILPGVLFFTVNRFDIVPALLTGLSLMCLGRDRPGLAGAVLAAAALTKVYPVLLVPVVLRYLGWERGPRFLAAWCVAGAGTLALMLLAYGREAVVGPFVVQLSRLPEIGGSFEDTNYTFYRYVLPSWLAFSGSGRLAVLGVLVLALCATRPPDLASVMRRCTLLLIGFVSLAVFFSPQWIVWLTPFVVPLLGRPRHRSATAAYVTFDLLTYFTFPLFMMAFRDDFRDHTVEALNRLGLGIDDDRLDARMNLILVYARAALLGWLSFGLLMAEGDALLPGRGKRPAAGDR